MQQRPFDITFSDTEIETFHPENQLTKLCNGTKAPDGYAEVNGNLVHHTAVIDWNVCIIGKNNIFGPYTVIGQSPQHKTDGTKGKVIIGNDNIFREFFNAQAATQETRGTVIGDRNYCMSNSVLHHDCILESDTVLCSGANIAGFVTIMKGAYIGMGSSVHQYQVIGSFALLGMNTCVIKSNRILPGRKYAGTPARFIGKNDIALQRHSIREEELDREVARYNNLINELN